MAFARKRYTTKRARERRKKQLFAAIIVHRCAVDLIADNSTSVALFDTRCVVAKLELKQENCSITTYPTRTQPFRTQLDTAGMREASERRVAPGTPINMLKKRLRRAEPPAAAAPAMMALNPPAQVAEVARNSTAGGAGTGVPGASSRSNLTARAQGKGKARAPSGHCDGVSRSLDEARMKHVSEYLKSQISEANMLLEVNG